jgi:ATP-dependent helicase Lhr and Lhr-like helicase
MRSDSSAKLATLNFIFPKNNEPPELHLAVNQWIKREIGALNELQNLSIPFIMNHQCTLILAPTGFGKTFAAFFGIINNLYLLAQQGKLEDKIYTVYVSPLRALNNDIHKNLEVPLQEISNLLGPEVKRVRTAVRTGDTTTYERAKMLQNPPHILITTPESLAIILASPKFSEKLVNVRWVIIDEIHDLANTKRGVHLSLSLEWLEYILNAPPTRIGLSATVSPINEIAHFLMGKHEDERTINIINYGKKKNLEIKVEIPLNNMTTARMEEINKAHIELIKKKIQQNDTTIVFTNTRYWSEQTARDLKKALPKEFENLIDVHHGSLDKEVRFNVEQRMKAGQMKAIVSSTSLELGIDIGSIDETVIIHSAKSVSRTIQRIGRSGHSFYQISKGTILPFDIDDLIENAAIAKLALEGEVDDVIIPINVFDVLAQIIVGLTLIQNWNLKDLYNLITKSYIYHTLSFEKFEHVIKGLSQPTEADEMWRYSRIWYDPVSQIIGKKSRQKQNYLMNVGTIPDIANVDVIEEETRVRIGTLTEKYSENLAPSDVFILGGKSYSYRRTVGNKVIVAEVFGQRPTIPSWDGERISRTWKVSLEIGYMFEELDKIFNKDEAEFIDKDALTAAGEFLKQNYPISNLGAENIVTYMYRQWQLSEIPTLNKIVVEKYIEPSGRVNLIVLSIFGRNSNLCIAQALGAKLSNILDTNVGTSVVDNGFSLILPHGADFNENDLFDLIETEEEFYDLIINSIHRTEMFKLRFRHVSTRGLMVLKRSSKNQMSVDQQHRSAQKLIRLLDKENPLIKETEREILYEVLDYDKGLEVFHLIKSGLIKILTIPQIEIPSPLTHNIILNSNTDLILLEDRRSLLLNLHKQVLDKLLPMSLIKTNVFNTEELQIYFHSKLSLKIHDLSDVVYNFVSKKPGITLEKIIIELKANNPDIKELKKNELENLIQSDPRICIDKDRVFTTITIAFKKLFKLMTSTELQQITSANNKETNEYIELYSKNLSPSDLIGKKLVEFLSINGPSNMDQLKSNFKMPENLIEPVIWELQRQQILFSGEFISNKREYMLSKDREDFLRDKVIKTTFIDSDSLNKYRHYIFNSSSSHGIIDIRDFLQVKGPKRVVFDLFQRFKEFSWTNLRQAMDTQDIFYAKFLGYRFCFLEKSFVLDFINAYRNNEILTAEVEKVYSQILTFPGISFYELQRMTNLPMPSIREAINFLETELYICRSSWELNYTSSPLVSFTRLLPLPSLPPKFHSQRKSQEMVVYWMFQWFSVLTLDEIMRLTRFNYETVESILRELINSSQLIERELIQGHTLYYGFEHQFQEVANFKQNEVDEQKIFLLSPFDISFIINGSQIQFNILSKHISFDIFQNTKRVGYFEVSTSQADYLQILNIHINRLKQTDPSFLYRFIDAVLVLSKTVFLVKHIVIEEVRSKALNHNENKFLVFVLKKLGFTLMKDYLIVGSQKFGEFTHSDVILLKLLNLSQNSSFNNDLNLVIRTLGRFTLHTILKHTTLQLSIIQQDLINLIENGQLFYISNHFVIPELLDKITDEITLSDLDISVYDFIKLKGSKVSESQLVREFRVTDNQIRDSLNRLQQNVLVHNAQPFSSTPVWISVSLTKDRVKEDLSQIISNLIEAFGPLSFDEILSNLEKYGYKSRIYILLKLTDLVQTKAISSFWVDRPLKQIYYYSSSIAHFVSDPGKATKIPEWFMISQSKFPIKELFKNHSLLFQGATHAIFNRGEVIAIFQARESGYKFEVINIRIDSDISDDRLLKLIQFLENSLIKFDYTEIEFHNIFGNNPTYWMEIVE